MVAKTKAFMALENKMFKLEIIAQCSTTKARVGKFVLPHSIVDTPVFMPVGTQGTMKAVTTKQLEDLDIRIILGNTYHLGNKPGENTMKKAGGLHKFMSWNRSLLTDSGGFQMVSLVKLAEFSEQGVKFIHPHDSTEMMLSPEKSIAIQNAIGADIMMQLDDVVSSTETDAKRFKLAKERSIRWLDRCLKAHCRPTEQILFPIIQGGLDEDLRRECLKQMTARDVYGFAIGGLSGGECKDDFWKMVTVSTDGLPKDKPRYLMGVGYTTELIVCSALGVDMFDCVSPTRTARFGCALVKEGQINVKKIEYSKDFEPIDKDCNCHTCRTYSRAYLHVQFRNSNPSSSSMLSVHNIAYQVNLMSAIRKAILEDNFPNFIKKRLKDLYKNEIDYPQWACDALESVGVKLR